MKDVIAIDIGNTNITAGVFKNGRLAAKSKLPTHTYSLYDPGFKSLFGKSGLNLTEEQEIII